VGADRWEWSQYMSTGEWELVKAETETVQKQNCTETTAVKKGAIVSDEKSELK
jgi:hypothetical protein